MVNWKWISIISFISRTKLSGVIIIHSKERLLQPSPPPVTSSPTTTTKRYLCLLQIDFHHCTLLLLCSMRAKSAPFSGVTCCFFFFSLFCLKRVRLWPAGNLLVVLCDLIWKWRVRAFIVLGVKFESLMGPPVLVVDNKSSQAVFRGGGKTGDHRNDNRIASVMALLSNELVWIWVLSTVFAVLGKMLLTKMRRREKYLVSEANFCFKLECKRLSNQLLQMGGFCLFITFIQRMIAWSAIFLVSDIFQVRKLPVFKHHNLVAGIVFSKFLNKIQFFYSV